MALNDTGAWDEYIYSAGSGLVTEPSIVYMNSTPAAPPPPVRRGAIQLMNILQLYVLPIVIAIGLLGNALSLAVFLGSYLNRYSSNVYLSALAISDSVFLISLVLSWASQVGYEFYNVQGWCQALSYLTYVASCLSVWYVVAFSLERYIAVCYPLRRQEMCTAKRARIVVITTAVLALLFYSFALFTMGVYPYGHNMRMTCLTSPKYYTAISRLTNIDTLITFIIPVIIIVSCNLRITYMVFWFYRERANLVSSGNFRRSSRASSAHTLPVRNSGGNASSRSPTSNSSQIKVTKMLLIVSTVFLLCNLPTHSLKTYLTIRQHLNPSYIPSFEFRVTSHVFQFVYYSNFSVNFFLYSISGTTFRKALFKLFRKSCSCVRNCLCRKSDDEISMMTAWNKKSRTMITDRGNPEKSHSGHKKLSPERIRLNQVDKNGAL